MRSKSAVSCLVPLFLSSGYYDAYYLKALRTKALIKKEFDQAFEKYDVLLAPAAPLYSAEDLGKA